MATNTVQKPGKINLNPQSSVPTAMPPAASSKKSLRAFSADEIKEIRRMSAGGMSASDIALQFGRSAAEVTDELQRVSRWG